ncbi:hypothetical protein [Kaistella faecalis]|uniref:hypothetical protein n=1 Tax=Kaistella faecalis TaxID=2852098 RepID=UPI001C495E09|nr:hypothetical protein [Chryseobacterium faecale]UFK98828.1 hypothetical protein LL667_05615 [Chryseobacterium faecale]
MEIPIYDNLKSFLENYENDFFNNYASQNITYFKYLTDLHDLYHNHYKKLKNKHDLNYDNILNIDSNTKTALALLQKETDEYEIKNLSEQILKGKSFLSQHEALYFKTEPELRELTAIIEKIKTDVIVQKDRLKTPFYNGQLQSQPPETSEIPDNDYSGKNELKPKEKLIVLDKLGIIDLLIKKLEYSDNATHLTEIIQSITGIDNQKGTLTGYCNYLIRPDHGNKNSPYFSENTVKKATQIYNTFRIKDKTD